jgi:ribosome assembly protein YihI (activator of Der GTPase)
VAVEYKDGKIGETKPLPEALGEFISACEDGTARALHVGTQEEVDGVKKKKDLQTQIDKLSNDVSELKAKLGSNIIQFPTAKEVKEILKKEN